MIRKRSEDYGDVAATDERSLSRWERVGVRGYDLSMSPNPSPGFLAAREKRPLPKGEVAELFRFEVTDQALALASHQNDRRGGDLQPDTDGKRYGVTAKRITQQPDRSRTEGVEDLSGRRGQADQHAERARVEFTLDDQRRQGDDIADRKPEQRAGKKYRCFVPGMDYQQQGNRLADKLAATVRNRR